MITCPNCNKINEDRHKFCLGCGARLPAAPPPAPYGAGAERGTRSPPGGQELGRPSAGDHHAPAPPDQPPVA
ncbi:MAG: zinc-ribbon domain-containing protein, partial [Acidobacteriota bacterium]